MNQKQIIIVVVIVIIVLVGIFFLPRNAGSTKLDGFAQCLTDKGAIFYGAWWCSHCQAQKKLFSSSERLLNYVECSTPDGNNQTQICIDKGVSQYPTWVFADGETVEGEMSLDSLAERTGCELPQ